MAASRIPCERANHAVAAVAAALEMAEFVRKHEKHKLSFRIGIQSSSVAARVLGRKKFLFDVWGDTVNTARRMESHGSEGQIQISRAPFELVRDKFWGAVPPSPRNPQRRQRRLQDCKRAVRVIAFDMHPESPAPH